MILVLRAGARRLAERRVEEDAADAGDVRMDTVEDLAARFVAVEALGDVVAQVAAGLGEADGQRMADPAARGLDCRRIVAQPTHDIAGCREAQRYLGILGLVVELVEIARLGLGAVAQLDRAGIDEGPLVERQFVRLVVGAFAHRQPCPRLLQRGRLVGELEGFQVAAARARTELLAHGLDDGLAVIGGDRRAQPQPHVGARCIGVPARPHDGVALAQRKAVADIGHGLGIVHALRPIGDVAEQHLAAAVVDFVEDPSVAAGGILGPQDEDVRRVLDLAAFIARRLVDQGDALVGGMRADRPRPWRGRSRAHRRRPRRTARRRPGLRCVRCRATAALRRPWLPQAGNSAPRRRRRDRRGRSGRRRCAARSARGTSPSWI